MKSPLKPKVLVLLVLASNASAKIIPADRQVDWTLAGVPGGIPARTRVCQTLQAGESAAHINAALAGCPAEGVVMLGPGVFEVTTVDFGLSSNITLRGSGVGITVLRNVGGPAVHLGVNSNWNAALYPESWTAGTLITAGLNVGSTVLSVESTAELSVGLMVRVDQLNNPAHIYAADGNNVAHTGQTTRIVSIQGHQVTLSPPIIYPFVDRQAHLKTQVNSGQRFQIDRSGLEDLSIEFGAGSGTQGILMEQAYACWLKNVELTNCPNYAVTLVSTLQCQIEHCDIRNTPNHGPNHYGIGLEGSAGWTLVLDNIVDSIFPNLEVNYGSSANAVVYNYLGDSWQDGFGMAASMDMNHGPGNLMNLYEGNAVGTYVQSDGYYGGSFNDVVFRNRVVGHSTFAGETNNKCVALGRWTVNAVVVGNVLGTAGIQTVYEANAVGEGTGCVYQLGYPNMGNTSFSGTVPPATWETCGSGCSQHRDLNVKATALIHANQDCVSQAVVFDPAIPDHNVPASLLHTAKPAWFGDRPWPPFDPLNAANASIENIPAGYRFVHGAQAAGSSSGPGSSSRASSSSTRASSSAASGGTASSSHGGPTSSAVSAGSSFGPGVSVPSASVPSAADRAPPSHGGGCHCAARVTSSTGERWFLLAGAAMGVRRRPLRNVACAPQRNARH